MRPRTAAVGMAAVLAGLGPIAQARAAATGTADGALTVTVPDQRLLPGCTTYPYSYTVAPSAGATPDPSAPPSTSTTPSAGDDEPPAWSVLVTASGPGSATDSRSGNGATTGTGWLTLCAGIDRPGTYAVNSSIAFGDQAPVAAPSTTFTVALSPARATVGVSPRKVRTGAAVALTGRTTYLHRTKTRSLPGVRVSLQYRLRGSTAWRTITNRTSSASGLYRYSWRSRLVGSADLRAVVPAGTYWSSVTTGSVRVTAIAARTPVPVKPPAVTTFANCTAMHAVYPHGVGKVGARDRVRGSTTPVTNFVRNDRLYTANARSDRDEDGVACERR